MKNNDKLKKFLEDALKQYENEPGYERYYEKCPECERLVPKAEIEMFVGICGWCRGYFLREELKFDR